MHLAPRASELADELRQTMPLYSSADEPAVRLLAVTLARVEAATKALDEIDGLTAGKALDAYTSATAPAFERLRQDLRSWINLARKLMLDLGLSPAARVRLGVDLVRGEAARLTVTRLARLAEDERAA